MYINININIHIYIYICVYCYCYCYCHCHCHCHCHCYCYCYYCLLFTVYSAFRMFSDCRWSQKPPYEKHRRPLKSAGAAQQTCNARATCCLTLPPGSAELEGSPLFKNLYRHLFTKASSKDCHCSLFCATACQQPFGDPSRL